VKAQDIQRILGECRANGRDVYRAAAAQALGITYEQVSDDQRKDMKSALFVLLYSPEGMEIMASAAAITEKNETEVTPMK